MILIMIEQQQAMTIVTICHGTTKSEQYTLDHIIDLLNTDYHSRLYIR